jgi:hypothetical protein
MASSSAASRAQVIWALVLPLAVLVGYLLADPAGLGSVAFLVLLVTVLCVPILMRWHHLLLVLTWHAAIIPYFLPGRPYLWMIMAVCSLFFSVLNRIVEPEKGINYEPSIARPMLVLALVVIGTAMARGGFGVAAFGSSTYGGRAYVTIMAAIIGFFALASVRLAPERVPLLVGLFFITGLTALIPNIAYGAGPAFNILFYLFPPEYVVEQVRADYAITSGIFRIYGLTPGSLALYCFLIARYGIRGTITHPLRLMLFIGAWMGCLFCGFRSILILFLLVFTLQFWLEGLFRTRIFPALFAIWLLAMAVLLPNTEHLPPVVQRTLSFLPVEIDTATRASAESSLQWRLEIWHNLVPEIPRYLWLGKGYAIDPSDLNLAGFDAMRGNTAERAIVAGDYHSGPLSLIIPLGFWGAAAVVWFWAATLRFMYWHYRYGSPALKTINTLLLSLFAARVIFFLVFFGGFYTDLFYFTGLAGLSVSINGARTPALQTTVQAEEPTDPAEWTPLYRRGRT